MLATDGLTTPKEDLTLFSNEVAPSGIGKGDQGLATHQDEGDRGAARRGFKATVAL